MMMKEVVASRMSAFHFVFIEIEECVFGFRQGAVFGDLHFVRLSHPCSPFSPIVPNLFKDDATHSTLGSYIGRFFHFLFSVYKMNPRSWPTLHASVEQDLEGTIIPTMATTSTAATTTTTAAKTATTCKLRIHKEAEAKTKGRRDFSLSMTCNPAK